MELVSDPSAGGGFIVANGNPQQLQVALVEYTSALIIEKRVISVLDGQIADFHRSACDSEHPRVGQVRRDSDRDALLVPTENSQRLVDEQLAAGEDDVAFDGKSNRATRRRIGDRLAQRTRTRIGQACDNNIGRSEMSWSRERKKQRN